MVLLCLFTIILIMAILYRIGDNDRDDDDDVKTVYTRPPKPKKEKSYKATSSFYSDRQMMRRAARFWRNVRWGGR